MRGDPLGASDTRSGQRCPHPSTTSRNPAHHDPVRRSSAMLVTTAHVLADRRRVTHAARARACLRTMAARRISRSFCTTARSATINGDAWRDCMPVHEVYSPRSRQPNCSASPGGNGTRCMCSHPPAHGVVPAARLSSYYICTARVLCIAPARAISKRCRTHCFVQLRRSARHVPGVGCWRRRSNKMASRRRPGGRDRAPPASTPPSRAPARHRRHRGRIAGTERDRLPSPVSTARVSPSRSTSNFVVEPSGRQRYLDASWRRRVGRLIVAEVDGALHLAPKTMVGRSAAAERARAR